MMILHFFGHTITLNGWQASLATAIVAFHDIILWPVFFVVGALTGKKAHKPKRLTKRSNLHGKNHRR